MDCPLKRRKDDIPKRPREKSWHCADCGVLLFGDDKPQCYRARAENAKAQVRQINQKLNFKD